MDFTKVDKTWTLFLDRDGVINEEKKGSYVLHRGEFIFYENVPRALQILSTVFGIIVMVTNQKGVGKKLMTLADLEDVHLYMQEGITAAGGRIDKIFFCTDLDDNSPDRKPNPGMALQAKELYPQIDFGKTIMVGNKLSDMRFGRNAGMFTVYIATTNPEIALPHELIDARFDTLYAFAQQWEANNQQ
ncbi:HAD-IIIA family hydrolase [Ilyomonas limi]|uniref:D,D-heptose 1,7-bisphosphate phosphatase n=1 Tax=Ilyomonas limi TaxID=2575867 RepID=A0A4U3L4Z3_9BACT|nr:HAD-IIIA family hydrolase [Ilyomonas limi]TKK68667.1 HAD-IIIA family hydrolase [Ilyomonas limi]